MLYKAMARLNQFFPAKFNETSPSSHKLGSVYAFNGLYDPTIQRIMPKVLGLSADTEMVWYNLLCKY